MARKFPDNTFVAPTMGTGLRLACVEAPGESEAAIGAPLVGGSGRIYDMLLSKAGLKRSEVSIVNCIQCRPPDNVFPTDPDARKYISEADASEAVAHCYRAHVEPVLKGRNWKRVDLFGDKPLRFIAKREGGIGQWRGSAISVPALGPEPKAIATYHPAYLMRDQSMIPVAINDLGKSLNIPPEQYDLFPSLDTVRAFVATSFAADIETNMGTGEIVMVGLSAKPWHAIAVPFRGAYIAELKRIFKNAKKVITQNGIGFDMPYLARNGVTVSDDCIIDDIMLMHHLLFPDFPHGLDFIGSCFGNKPAWKELPKPDYTEFSRYCCRDVDVTLMAHTQLLPMLRQERLDRLYYLVQVPLARICRLMHEQGFKIAPERIGKVREQIGAEMAELEAQLPESLRTHNIAVNKRVPAPPGTLSEKTKKPLKFLMVPAEEVVTPWRSDKKVGEYIYGELGLATQRHAKTGSVTTNKSALDRLYNKTHNKSLAAIRKLRALDELMTTFCKEEMLSVDKMYPHFNPHGTNSGRLSSSDPNLQNIPESTRHIYVPSHVGWAIIDVDYSGIESRITALLANDRDRLNKYLTIPGYSEHKYLASIITGQPYDSIKKSSVPDSPYSKAKHVVHGFNYGLGAKKCSAMYDMEFKETKELFARWAKEIPATVEWREATAARAKADGVLVTPFGRKRWFWTSSYYTEALSFIPQSTAADVIYRAMIGLMYERIDWPVEKVQEVVRLYRPLPKPAELLIQVHDSLVFQCPVGMVDEVVATIKEVMEQPFAELGGFSIPIGINVGESWGTAETYRPQNATNSKEAN